MSSLQTDSTKTSSETREQEQPQFVQDTRSILSDYGVSIAVGFTLCLAGFLLCLLLPAPERDISSVPVTFDEVSSLLNLDLANSACNGGTAEALHLLTNIPSSSNVSNVNGTAFLLSCQTPRLSRKAYVTIAATLGALVAMINEAPPDLAMLGATLVLLLWPWTDDKDGPGIISESEAWQGFSNSGVLTVAALFIVARAVDSTGIVDRMMKRLLGKPSSLFFAQLRLLLPVALFSGFMNNTPIVAMLIPVVKSWAPRIGHKPSKFMMPLSFASMLGGMCTMLGTSTNLVVAGLLAHHNPEIPAFGIFDVGVVGAPCALVGILYMAFASNFMLNGHDDEEESLSGNGTDAEAGTSGETLLSFSGARAKPSVPFYTVTFTVDVGGGVEGEDAMSLGFPQLSLHKDGVQLARITAGSNRDVEGRPLSEHEALSAGDRLLFQGTSEGVAKIRRQRGLELSTSDFVRALGRRRNRRFLVEAVVADRSELVGTTWEHAGESVQNRYGTALLSIRSRRPSGAGSTSSSSRRRTSGGGSVGDSYSPMLGDVLRSSMDVDPHENSSKVVEGGDVLLLEAFPHFVEMYKNGRGSQNFSDEFVLITPVAGSAPPRRGTYMDNFRSAVAVVSLVTMVALSVAGVMSLLLSALLAAAVMLLAKTITLEQAFGAIKGRTLLAIVTTFGVGTAFQNTGAAYFIAQGLISVFGRFGVPGVVLAVALVTSIVGCAVSNNATVILMYPICASLAQEIDGLSLPQLLVVLMVGASSSFLTPMSYQTNLMVLSPGGYRFTDYFKFGITLQLLMVITSVSCSLLFADYYNPSNK